MQQYIVRRLALLIVVLWIVVTFVFISIRVLPGDYAAQQVALQYFSGQNAAGFSPAQALHEARARLGLGENYFAQYAHFLGDLLRGDFGKSFHTRAPAFNTVKDALPYSLQLGLMTAFVALLIGIPVGIISAIRQDSWLDGGLRLIAIVGLAAPVFFTATLGTLAVLHWHLWTLDVVHHPGIWNNPAGSLRLYAIPALAGGLASGAVLMRFLRSQVLDVLRQDYIRTAWSKGLRERSVIIRHALRNAMIPVITVFGFLVTGVVSGNVILETMFNIPGMGQSLVTAIATRDVPVVQAMVLVTSAGILLIHLAVDISYALIDPRVTLG